MKKFILPLILAIIALPAIAQERVQDQDGWLKPVDRQYVCMVNNQSYDTPQISVEVEGKTYYGCCLMCKTKLEKVPALRSATDPVSGNTVNKAEAVIGAGPDRTVYYFENEENFHAYANGPMPEMHHKDMDKMDGMMMEGNGHNHEQ